MTKSLSVSKPRREALDSIFNGLTATEETLDFIYARERHGGHTLAATLPSDFSAAFVMLQALRAQNKEVLVHKGNAYRGGIVPINLYFVRGARLPIQRTWPGMVGL